MYYVYVLYGQKDNNLHVGCGSNLYERIKRHNSGIVPSTKNRRPLTLIHREKFKDGKEAFKREKFLKSLWSGRIKRKIKQRYLEGAKRGRSQG